MMKRFSFLVVLSALSCGSLMAHLHPKNGGWQVTGEYLYLLPTVDDTYFVINGVSAPPLANATRENNDFDFHSGFRVGGAYGFCGCDREFQAYYTRLKANQDRTVTGGFLAATVGTADFASGFEGYAGSASSSLDLLYQRVDGLFAQQIYCGCGSNVYLFSGIEYANLQFDEDYTYASAIAVGVVNQSSRTWGIGPQFGIDFDYALWDFSSCSCPGGLSLAARSSVSILASKTHESTTNTSVVTVATTFADLQDQHTWRVVPALHASLGLNYTLSICSCLASLEVGYEFSSYLRGLTRIGLPDDVADDLAFTNYYNFDIQGLYIAASVGF